MQADSQRMVGSRSLCSSDKTFAWLAEPSVTTYTQPQKYTQNALILWLKICRHFHTYAYTFFNHGLMYAASQTCIYTHMKKWLQTSQGVRERMSEEEGAKLLSAAFTASPPPLMATHDKSSIQTRGGGGDEEAKHGDGDTKNVISSSHSRVLVQYGSGISGD